MLESMHDKYCAICTYSRCNVTIQPCGHHAHARCIYPWPVVVCPVCNFAVQNVTCLDVESFVYQGTLADISNTTIVFGIFRKGRWTKEEQDYVQLMIEAFNSGMVPVEEKCKLGTFLCRVLQCQPARLSSKIRTGKKVFHSRMRTAVTTPEIVHYLNLQRKLSEKEDHFLTKIAAADLQEASALSFHIQYFWSQNFVQSWGGSQHQLVQYIQFLKPLPAIPMSSTTNFLELLAATQRKSQSQSNDLLSVVHDIFSRASCDIGVVARISTRTVLFSSASFQSVHKMFPDLDHLSRIDDMNVIFKDSSALIDAILSPVELETFIQEEFLYSFDPSGPWGDSVSSMQAFRRTIPKFLVYEDSDWCTCTVLVFFANDISIALVLLQRHPPVIDVFNEKLAVSGAGAADGGGIGAEQQSMSAEGCDAVGSRRSAAGGPGAKKRRSGGVDSHEPIGSTDAVSHSAVSSNSSIGGTGGGGGGGGAEVDLIAETPRVNPHSFSGEVMSFERAVGSFFLNMTNLHSHAAAPHPPAEDEPTAAIEARPHCSPESPRSSSESDSLRLLLLQQAVVHTAVNGHRSSVDRDRDSPWSSYICPSLSAFQPMTSLQHHPVGAAPGLGGDTSHDFGDDGSARIEGGLSSFPALDSLEQLSEESVDFPVLISAKTTISTTPGQGLALATGGAGASSVRGRGTREIHSSSSSSSSSSSTISTSDGSRANSDHIAGGGTSAVSHSLQQYTPLYRSLSTGPSSHYGSGLDPPAHASVRLPTAVTDAFSRKLGNFLRIIPFDVIELWVPVRLSPISTVLLFGGSASSDSKLQGWSAYSRNFFFTERVGLPGRVMQDGEVESRTDVASLTHETFLRAEGAMTYGIHATVGLPLGLEEDARGENEDTNDGGSSSGTSGPAGHDPASVSGGPSLENAPKSASSLDPGEQASQYSADGQQLQSSTIGDGDNTKDARTCHRSSCGGSAGNSISSFANAPGGAVIVLYSKKVFEPSKELIAYMAKEIKLLNIQTSVRLLKRHIG